MKKVLLIGVIGFTIGYQSEVPLIYDYAIRNIRIKNDDKSWNDNSFADIVFVE